MAATPIDIWVETRIPVIITGQASGSRMRKRIAVELMPCPRADSMTSSLTLCKPTMALRRMGRTA